MSVTDPIADMLTMVRNGVAARHEKVDVRLSKMNHAIADVLKQEGFIRNVRQMPSGLRIYLRYDPQGRSFLRGVQRVSKPGLRVYAPRKELRAILRGLGVAIVSTPQGIMTDRQARQANIGGEVLCKVW